ncbi:MAG: hypothetical protein HN567_04900 [Actinobacteria bacterium]|jgi:membrane protein implicated in regulation of membrane protease activity|nr:hypothetical protein [Actinomycetota bacterium]MBT3747048.1 hypothetical protein [Actinomycetota bacterium]MBT3968956.1 hypothetical protein [Actinomycetota bacterium]MBT4009597.1 hypothetical protein [Actinomycetota bacterium]MBT4303323.1 hypothetical protein [Actinomycetota bacterium]
MFIMTLTGIAALIIGWLINWPVLVALSAIFVAVQLMMTAARAAVDHNDRRLAERLKDS